MEPNMDALHEQLKTLPIGQEEKKVEEMAPPKKPTETPKGQKPNEKVIRKWLQQIAPEKVVQLADMFGTLEGSTIDQIIDDFMNYFDWTDTDEYSEPWEVMRYATGQKKIGESKEKKV